MVLGELQVLPLQAGEACQPLQGDMAVVGAEGVFAWISISCHFPRDGSSSEVIWLLLTIKAIGHKLMEKKTIRGQLLNITWWCCISENHLLSKDHLRSHIQGSGWHKLTQPQGRTVAAQPVILMLLLSLNLLLGVGFCGSQNLLFTCSASLDTDHTVSGFARVKEKKKKKSGPNIWH